MITWGFIFLLAALPAAWLGFGQVRATPIAAVGRLLFFCGIMLFLASTILGLSPTA